MTLGDLHALACAQLAYATLPLVRGTNPVANGDLDPTLSSLHRVCDGVRMVAAYALQFLDDPRPYDSPITAAELLRLAEERGHFLSEHGVCAGPTNMIREFLETLIDGRAPAGDGSPADDRAGEVPRAFDYALLGIMQRSLTSTLWLRMMEAYERLRAVLFGAELVVEGPLARLRERVEGDWASAAPSHLDRPAQRAWEEPRFAELFEHARRGLRGASEVARTRSGRSRAWTWPSTTRCRSGRTARSRTSCTRSAMRSASQSRTAPTRQRSPSEVDRPPRSRRPAATAARHRRRGATTPDTESRRP